MRRSVALAAFLPLLLVAVPAAEASPDPIKRHALSLIGKPKQDADFKHFDWVNPSAPQGGTVRLGTIGSYDSLNPFSVRGVAVNGIRELVYEQLMVDCPDQATTSYGLIAHTVSYPEDVSSATFDLRPEARFDDGRPVTPEDVIFSLGALKASHPSFASYYKNVVRAEKTGEHQVTFHFDVKGNRELPVVIGSLYVLPKHFWEAKGSDGQPRDLAKASWDRPVGSGPYRIKEFDAGRSIAYERRENWWANGLPVTRGSWNFKEIRFNYYKDATPALEDFKIGHIDYRAENSAKHWASGYDFPAQARGLVKKDQIWLSRPASMQAFAFNLRRKQFQDPRVRQAFNLAFDFEWANNQIFFDQYVRTGSFFENTEMKASSLPTGREVELLDEVRRHVPPEVFTQIYKNPVNAEPEDARRHLGEAARLLAEAGWRSKDGVLVNAQGEPLVAELLFGSALWERLFQPYANTLQRLGIKVTLRRVDAAQYEERIKYFDFDIIVDGYPITESPGNELRGYWGSAAADTKGSRNRMGLKSPAVDTLIERIIFAKDRAELVAAARALDRVLLWNHYVVPHWHIPYARIAYWDRFGRPGQLPSRDVSFLRVWWHDAEAAKKLEASKGR